jgi:hypothetical protein
MDAYPTDPMDAYLDSIGADSCSPPNNTMWYYLQSQVNIDSVYIWITSGAGSNFHSWVVGFVANSPADFCTGGLTFLGCINGAADDQGIDTASFPLYGVQAGTVYVFMIDGFNGSTGPFSIAVKSGALTSVDEAVTANFNVYPNPAMDKIHIQSSRQKTKEVVLTMINVYGQSVLTKNYDTSFDMDIDVSTFPNGIYYLLMSTKDESLQTKTKILVVH